MKKWESEQLRKRFFLSKNLFELEVLSLKGLIFEEDVSSVYLFGVEGEFELLPYHFPLLAAIVESEIQIKGFDSLPVWLGVVMFRDNQCTIIAEMAEGYDKLKKAWN